jgi:uncharacterized protein
LTRLLSPLECRILGVLVEKQHTVPDSYPLSLNALQNGCNQKTSRATLMDASETDLSLALDQLQHDDWVIAASGGRVARYNHNLGRVLHIPSQAVAILTCLILRGALTTAEIRLNSDRFHAFADVSAVEAFLEELATRPADKGGALVKLMPKAPGAREARWMHCLSGEPVQEPSQAVAGHEPSTVDISASEVATLRLQVAQLTDKVSALESKLQAVCAELGISP